MKQKVKLTLDVEYELNDEPRGAITNRLFGEIDRAVGNGLLSGEGPATVYSWGVKIEFPTEPEYKEFKIFQAVEDSNGDPDFYFCIVRCTQEQFDNGDYFDVVSRQAEEMGYTPHGLYYDEFCHAGKAMMHLFEWDTASIFTV